MTYGDGLANIDIARRDRLPSRSGACKATVACVRPPARFGRVVVEGTQAISFEEKPQAEGGLINGGFFVLEPSVLELIEGAHTVWEKEPMESLAANGQLAAWIHRGFWQPMDTLRDKQHLNALWDSGAAPWKLWQDEPSAPMVGLVTRLPRVRRPARRDDGRSRPAASVERVSRLARRRRSDEKRYPLRAKVCEQLQARAARLRRGAARSCSAITSTSPRTPTTGWRMRSGTAKWRAGASRSTRGAWWSSLRATTATC